LIKKRKVVRKEKEKNLKTPKDKPIKKRRLSTPYVSKEQRRNTISRIFSDLMKETELSSKIVLHALIVYSGNVNLARQYLLNLGDISKCEVKPWSPVDDVRLLSKDSRTAQDIIKK